MKQSPVFFCPYFYLIAIVLGLLSLWAFSKNYAFGSLKRTTEISIKSVSNGSQELVSYLITMIVPFGVISTSILSEGWLRLVCYDLYFFILTNLVR